MSFSRLSSKSREFVFGYVEPKRGETDGWVLSEDAFSLDHSSCELPLLIDRNTYIHARDSEFEVGGALGQLRSRSLHSVFRPRCTSRGAREPFSPSITAGSRSTGVLGRLDLREAGPEAHVMRFAAIAPDFESSVIIRRGGYVSLQRQVHSD